MTLLSSGEKSVRGMWKEDVKNDKNNGFTVVECRANGAVLFKCCGLWLQLAAQLDRCCKVS